MENDDIRQEILLNIDAEVKSYTQSCAVDKKSRQICSTKHYWDKIFSQHRLPLSPIVYTTPKGWIKAFEKEEKIQVYIDILLDVMHNQENKGMDDLSILYVGGKHFNYEQLYNLPHIDVEKLSELWNKYSLSQISSNNDDGAQMKLYYDDDKYIVQFEFDFNARFTSYFYETTLDVIRIILHRVLSAGITPYNAHGDDIKLF